MVNNKANQNYHFFFYPTLTLLFAVERLCYCIKNKDFGNFLSKA